MRPPVAGSSSLCAQNCMPTATGCSARSMTPMMLFRARCACLERAAQIRGSQLASFLALPNRDERMSGRDRAAAQTPAAWVEPYPGEVLSLEDGFAFGYTLRRAGRAKIAASRRTSSARALWCR
jgi:hypothetical protein